MNRLLLRKCLALQMLIFDAGELQIRQNWVQLCVVAAYCFAILSRIIVPHP